MRRGISHAEGFLALLRDNGIDNFAVVGGAVRDLYYGREASDIDAAIVIRAPVGAERATYRSFTEEFDYSPLVLKAAEPLAGLLGCTLDDLVDNRGYFASKPVDLLGLRSVYLPDSDIHLPDIFLDIRQRRVYAFPPLSLSINHLALTTNGELIASSTSMLDLKNRIARFANPPLDGYEPQLHLLLFLAKFIRRYDLAWEASSHATVSAMMAGLREHPEAAVPQLFTGGFRAAFIRIFGEQSLAVLSEDARGVLEVTKRLEQEALRL